LRPLNAVLAEQAACPPHTHRTLTITRKGGKVVTIPLVPRTAQAIDLAIGERTDGPVFLAADGQRLDRHGAGRIVRKIARRAGIGKAVTPHTLRHAFITAALDAGVPLRDVQEAACSMSRPSWPADRGVRVLAAMATGSSPPPGTQQQRTGPAPARAAAMNAGSA
jgi:Phage integrase family